MAAEIRQNGKPARLFLSPPHMSGREWQSVQTVFQSNWIAPVGPMVEEFERSFATVVGIRSAAAVSSGTAALHLAARLLGVGEGDEVLCSTLTFIASANPVTYLGATPVFIDSEASSWNMDPELLGEELRCRAKRGKLPRAAIVVDVLGQSADHEGIANACDKWDVPIIEDAAEALGALYKGIPVGRFGRLGVFSFNGNKIITTSGGGMLVSDEDTLVQQAVHFATQAREPAPHYQHTTVGYNYRLSNILAAIGLAQLEVLQDRVKRKRAIFDYYLGGLGGLPGLAFMPEADYGRSSRWLTCVLIEPTEFGADREGVRLALEKENIESRPVWKPLHMQPVFAGCSFRGSGVAESIFRRGLCLPSGTAMSHSDQDRVIEVVRSCCRTGMRWV